MRRAHQVVRLLLLGGFEGGVDGVGRGKGSMSEEGVIVMMVMIWSTFSFASCRLTHVQAVIQTLLYRKK